MSYGINRTSLGLGQDLSGVYLELNLVPCLWCSWWCSASEREFGVSMSCVHVGEEMHGAWFGVSWNALWRKYI